MPGNLLFQSADSSFGNSSFGCIIAEEMFDAYIFEHLSCRSPHFAPHISSNFLRLSLAPGQDILERFCYRRSLSILQCTNPHVLGHHIDNQQKIGYPIVPFLILVHVYQIGFPLLVRHVHIYRSPREVLTYRFVHLQCGV
eukprot:Lithocolla_globosa_v1_NODE_6363_length_1097_cov_63.108445.p2 type:complete len:140 gc:universal NODE_6363_length_1097_cov_63.108445:650-231(-)